MAFGQWLGSALVQIMACHLCRAKPLSKPMLGYCQLDPYKQTHFSEILIKIYNFSFMKKHRKISSVKWRPYCPGEDKLNHCTLLVPYDIINLYHHRLRWLLIAWLTSSHYPIQGWPVTNKTLRNIHKWNSWENANDLIHMSTVENSVSNSGQFVLASILLRCMVYYWAHVP